MKKGALERIRNQFFNTIIGLRSARSGIGFLEEFFTESEQILFIKRLAIIIMLNEHFSYYRIQKTLNVSTSTIKRMHEHLLSGKYDAIRKIYRKRKEREAFWDDLEVLMRAGMPPMGRGRWSALYARTAHPKKQKNKKRRKYTD